MNGEMGEELDGLVNADELADLEGDTPIEPVEPTTYLRDLTEDDVYSRLQSVKDFPNRMSSLESRLFGSMGPVNERIKALEASLGNRPTVNVEALKALEEYDPKLAELLAKVLPSAISVNPLDETTLKPFLDPVRQQLAELMGDQLVKAFIDPKRFKEVLPEVDAQGVMQPKGQLQQDFADWFSQQDWETQQAFTVLGPDYIRAWQKFERWEEDKQGQRTNSAQSKTQRLKGAQVPQAAGRQAAGEKSAEAAWLAGFNEVINARKR